MGRTKKVWRTGRFGVRYGLKIRKRVIQVEKKQYQKHMCPYCGFKKVERIGTGLYRCKKCGKVFAGGAYYPRTDAGELVLKVLANKRGE